MKLSTKYIILALLIVFMLVLLRNKLKQAAAFVAPETMAGDSWDWRGDSRLPVGIRNNNPGNLKQTTPRQGWLGAASETPDPPFESFVSYRYGLRAAIKLLRNKASNGYNTPRKLINLWAPVSDNSAASTNNYINQVADSLGTTPDQVFNPDDKDTVYKIMSAIEEWENDMTVINEQEFNAAWTLQA